MPTPFLQNYEVLQRTYFVIEQLKLVDTLYGKVFDAIHEERRNFNDVAVMADWMATQGVDCATFMNQCNSFTVVTKAAQATQLTNAYKIEGVPMLGVAGHYLTEGTPKGLRVVESLVADIRAGR